MTKIFVVLTSVLAIAVSCLFIAFAAQTDNWRTLATTYQTQRDAAFSTQQASLATAQASLALKDQTISQLNSTVQALQRQADELNEKFAQARAEATAATNEQLTAEAGRAKLQELLDITTGDLKAVQKQRQDLLAQTIDLQSRNARANDRVLELTTNVSILTEEVRNLREKLVASEQRQGLQPSGIATTLAQPENLPPGAVPTSPRVAGDIRGQVTDVQGVYASVNVGEASGVAPGMAFMVYRTGGDYLGELVIEQVRAKEAGGKLRGNARDQVRAGDLVMLGGGR